MWGCQRFLRALAFCLVKTGVLARAVLARAVSYDKICYRTFPVHLENADTIRMKSRTGNIVCEGEVPSPIPVPDPMFKSGFEQVP